MLSGLCQENHLLPAYLEHATAGHPLRKSRPNTRNLILIAIFLQVFNKKRPFRITELDSLRTVMLQEAVEFLPPAQVPRTHTQSFELLPLFPKYPTLSSEASNWTETLWNYPRLSSWTTLKSLLRATIFASPKHSYSICKLHTHCWYFTVLLQALQHRGVQYHLHIYEQPFIFFLMLSQHNKVIKRSNRQNLTAEILKNEIRYKCLMIKVINHLNSLSKNVVDFLSTEAMRSIHFSSRHALIYPEIMKISIGLLVKVPSSLQGRKSLSQNDLFLDFYFYFYDLQTISGLWYCS